MTYASEVLADSPLLYWRLGEASGTTAADASGNSKTGTYNGTPTRGVASLIATDPSNTAVQFNGTDDCSFGGTLMSSSPGASLEIWFKTTATTVVASLYEAGVSNITIYGDGHATVLPTSKTTITLGPTNKNDGNTHHAVLTYSTATATISLYIDGTLAASSSITGAGGFYASAARAFRSQAAVTTAGTGDEFAVYTTALSAARVAAHYAAASPPPPITIHPNKITSTGTVRAPSIVPYVAPVDGNITITAELAPARWSAAATQPNRSAEVQPARLTAGVKP